MILEVIASWFIADLITGLIHFLEDHYLDGLSKYEFLNELNVDNDLHHAHPFAFTAFSYWENINTSVYVAWPVALGLWLLDAPMLAWLPVFMASFANIVHRWAHLGSYNVPSVVQWLQKTGLFTSGQHHFGHHFDINGTIDKELSSIRFCVMTNWMNPILDYLKIFVMLEYLLMMVGIWPKIRARSTYL